jgi:hypothetical protein
LFEGQSTEASALDQIYGGDDDGVIVIAPTNTWVSVYNSTTNTTMNVSSSIGIPANSTTADNSPTPRNPFDLKCVQGCTDKNQEVSFFGYYGCLSLPCTAPESRYARLDWEHGGRKCEYFDTRVVQQCYCRDSLQKTAVYDTVFGWWEAIFNERGSRAVDTKGDTGIQYDYTPTNWTAVRESYACPTCPEFDTSVEEYKEKRTIAARKRRERESNQQGVCDEYSEDAFTEVVLTGLLLMFVVGFNAVVLPFAIHYAIDHEKFADASQIEVYKCIGVALGKLVCTGVILPVAAAFGSAKTPWATSGTGDDVGAVTADLGPGVFGVFHRSFFGSGVGVGQIILLAYLAEWLRVNLSTCWLIYKRKTRRNAKLRLNTIASQTELDELYMPPEYDLTTRAADSIYLFGMALVFAFVLPLMMILCFLHFFISASLDRWMLLRICRLPAGYTHRHPAGVGEGGYTTRPHTPKEKLSESTVAVLPFILLAHICVTMAALSNPWLVRTGANGLDDEPNGRGAFDAAFAALMIGGPSSLLLIPGTVVVLAILCNFELTIIKMLITRPVVFVLRLVFKKFQLVCIVFRGFERQLALLQENYRMSPYSEFFTINLPEHQEMKVLLLCLLCLPLLLCCYHCCCLPLLLPLPSPPTAPKPNLPAATASG